GCLFVCGEAVCGEAKNTKALEAARGANQGLQGCGAPGAARCVVYQLTASFRALPGRNFGTLAFLILIVSPVRGLRPVRAARAETANVPKPTSVTVPPFLSVVLTAPIRASSERPAAALEISALLAI